MYSCSPATKKSKQRNTHKNKERKRKHDLTNEIGVVRGVNEVVVQGEVHVIGQFDVVRVHQRVVLS